MMALVRMYANAIRDGKRTIESVPAKFKELVEKELLSKEES